MFKIGALSLNALAHLKISKDVDAPGLIFVTVSIIMEKNKTKTKTLYLDAAQYIFLYITLLETLCKTQINENQVGLNF